MLPVKIIGTGVYAPGEPIDNEELKKLANIEFDSEKMSKGLGISQRHIAHLRNLDETTADFATKAALNAIKDAGLKNEDINLFVVATDTPEFISPSTAIVVQGRIQKQEFWTSAFDVNSSCASFAIALDNIVRVMTTDPTIKYAVVIGVYNMPAFIRKGDDFGYSIFADGAGAFVLERNESGESAYVNGQLLTDGTQWDYVGVYSGGTRNPVTHEKLDNNEFGLQNLKPLPGDRNVRLWPIVIEHLLKKSNAQKSDIDHYIFTQINRSVIKKVMAAIEEPLDKTTMVMDRYGYTGSGCIPMAFHHAVKDGKIKRGDKVIFVASGAGLAVGSNMFIY